MDLRTLRAQFPVLEHTAYLNAGTDGPLPAVAARAGAQELLGEAECGRARAHFERRSELGGALRGCYARALGCDPEEVALTTCTTEGLSIVIDGLGLQPGEEILTSDEEHPGLLGVLAAAREANGVVVRMAPLERIVEQVGPLTRLVACSHVSWMTGRLAPTELAELDIPVVLDGAQGVGAIHTDVRALGCDAYAGAGQKWLCGPDGMGMLYVSPELRERVRSKRRGYGNLLDPGAGIDARLHEDARRFDTLALSAEALATALAAIEALESAGWDAIHERSLALAALLIERLGETDREVTPHGPTTLVSFSSPDPEAERGGLVEAGVVLRDIPGKPWLRASVGAWNDERDLDRLLATLAR
ncbi:MAG: aminotransferase class V-fold PLP-dependent enzyme [Solirubrobacteraceae bacterium]